MSTDQRPAETAARQHRENEAALVVSQLAQDAHSKEVMAGPEGYSVTDRTDPAGDRAEADGPAAGPGGAEQAHRAASRLRRVM